MPCLELLSLLNACLVWDRSDYGAVRVVIDLTVAGSEASDRTVWDIYFTGGIEGLFINFGEGTLRSANIEMLELANDLIDAPSKLLIDGSRSAVNTFGNGHFEDVSGSGTAISIFIYVVDRHASYQSFNVTHRAIE